mmetsp:Transcript_51512/g.119738  ORF Transcript_51512/g.119738 Transcript_51512/m.119738 type:complete len:208 (-) Transcript_51512:96-719(-)
MGTFSPQATTAAMCSCIPFLPCVRLATSLARIHARAFLRCCTRGWRLCSALRAAGASLTMMSRAQQQCDRLPHCQLQSGPLTLPLTTSSLRLIKPCPRLTTLCASGALSGAGKGAASRRRSREFCWVFCLQDGVLSIGLHEAPAMSAALRAVAVRPTTACHSCYAVTHATVHTVHPPRLMDAGGWWWLQPSAGSLWPAACASARLQC